ncbi:MAG: hypothetical protein E7065_08670 [Lentimicrobiaceae bacterium]|nr:hypothetical protein [Lentimicrobiaceae bacterium]
MTSVPNDIDVQHGYEVAAVQYEQYKILISRRVTRTWTIHMKPYYSLLRITVVPSSCQVRVSLR